MSEQVIQIKIQNEKPLISNEMQAAVMGKFHIETGFIDSDQGVFQHHKQSIPWETCKEIYRAMVMASVGNVGKVFDSTTQINLSADQPRKDIRIVFSVPGNVGLKEWVIRNQEEPKTMKSLDVIRDKIKSATLYKDIVIVAWEALESKIQ